MMSEYILKSDAIKAIQKYGVGCLDADDFSPEQSERFVINKLNELHPVKLRKGQWLRMSDLSEKEDDRYQCSCCGNVVHYKSKMNLYTFNSWCGRCGCDNDYRNVSKEIEIE